MTSLAPVSRAVPQERTPLNLLPPSQPRPTTVTEETTSTSQSQSQSKDIAVVVVDSNKSFASLFGSKSVAQPEQDSNEQNRTHDNQSNQGQFNQGQGQDRGQSSDRFDRPYGQNNQQQQQHSNQNQNDRNFPSFNQQRNDGQRDRDGQGQGQGQDRDDRHWNDNNNNNSNNNNNNNDDQQPPNSVARKRQLFDPKSNKMVDPELHPENLPPTENQKSRGQNQGQGQGQGGDKGEVPQDILKRARPAHPRFDEFDNTWRRGVSNPKNKDKDKEDSKTGAAASDVTGESNGATNEVRNR